MNKKCMECRIRSLIHRYFEFDQFLINNMFYWFVRVRGLYSSDRKFLTISNRMNDFVLNVCIFVRMSSIFQLTHNRNIMNIHASYAYWKVQWTITRIFITHWMRTLGLPYHIMTLHQEKGMICKSCWFSSNPVVDSF